MKLVSASDFDQMLSNRIDFQLIDVRENYEFEEHNAGGVNIPLSDVLSHADQLNNDKKVVFCCKSGTRSAAMIHTLERKFGMQNLYYLEGGIESYFESKK